MVGGWSNEKHINDISALTWHLAAEMNIYVYFEWVESAANIIDAASRAKSDSDHEVYLARGWKRVAPVEPWSLLFSDPSASAARRYKFHSRHIFSMARCRKLCILMHCCFTYNAPLFWQ